MKVRQIIFPSKKKEETKFARGTYATCGRFIRGFCKSLNKKVEGRICRIKYATSPSKDLFILNTGNSLFRDEVDEIL